MLDASSAKSQPFGAAHGIEQHAGGQRARGERAHEVVVAGDADDALRAQAGRRCRFGGHCPKGLPAGPDLGEDGRGQPERTDQIFRPAAAMQIECQRARSKRQIGGRNAAQPPGQVVSDVQPEPRARESFRRILFEPQQLA